MSDLQRCLSLDKRLSWQVFRFVTSSSPVSGGSQLPGILALEKFLKIAAEKGVASEVVDQARSALGEFGGLIRAHAGDRTTFDAMLSGLEGDEVEPIDVATRRQAFRANSRIWGVQTKVQLSLAAFGPTRSDPASVDVLGLRGLFSLRRIRSSAAYVFAATKLADDDGTTRRSFEPRPIDADGVTPEGVDLIRQFSSQPLPQFRKHRDAFGRTNIEICGNGVGNQSAVTYVGGSFYEGAFARYRDAHNLFNETTSAVRTPCEVLITDFLVRHGTFGSITPTATVFSDHRGSDPTPYGRECDLLPLTEPIQHLGRGTSALLTPDLPRYAELVEYAFEQVGWSPEDFEAYRCRLEYPILPSTVAMRFPLQEKLAGSRDSGGSGRAV